MPAPVIRPSRERRTSRGRRKRGFWDSALLGVIAGVALAFFAMTGFENAANVAEDTVNALVVCALFLLEHFFGKRDRPAGRERGDRIAGKEA